MIAAPTYRNIQAQHNSVGKSQLHLTVIAAWSENAQAGNHAMPRPDQCHSLLSSDETVLVERLIRRQLVAFAEEALQILLGDMAMPSRHIDDQLGRRSLDERSCRDTPTERTGGIYTTPLTATVA